MTKPNWVNTSPNSGNGNGSIEVTAQANEGDARSGSVAVAGGGLSKTIAVNQNAALLPIGDFNRTGADYGLWAVANIQAIGIKGIAYCTMSDSSIIEKDLNSIVNIAESEHCAFVSLEGRRINNSVKTLIINMQTTTDFIPNADNLCELFTDIDFNSSIRNTQFDVVPYYESLVYEINDRLLNRYPDNIMFINFNIVDFDDAAKQRIQAAVTCDRLVVAF